MKFRRLRLQGFKSFVEPTDLEIENGLTGIVGPNGCGKSNLLEALRWVMGDNSPKSMRGAGMEDVIFAGTSGRSSRNNAEVTLWLENEDRAAPAEYNQSDSLEITRRIERDAGSAYRINSKDVRARDVQLLFADQSTGAHSPALVKQGQIGQLINSKPKARRQILEEAAGISGLHSRRHEAELKLRAAETNLTRLDDVLQQIESQLQGLKRQARQASRYRNLSGHIRKAEALVMHLRWTQARENVIDADARLKEATDAVVELTQLAAQATTADTEAGEALPPLREEEAKAAAGLHRLTVERERLDEEERQAKEEAERLQARQIQITHDIEREKTMSGDAEEVLTRLTQEKSDLEAASGSEEELVNAAREAAKASGEALAQKEESLDRLTAEAARLTAQRTTLERALEEAQAREQKLRTRLEDALSEMERLRPTPEAVAEIERARLDVANAQEIVDGAEHQVAESEAARLRAQNTEATAREPLQEAERISNHLRTEAQTLARVLQVEETGLWPPMIDAVSVETGYEKALGSALGDDLDIPADSAAPMHWDTLPPLANASPLPAGATPLSQYVTGPEALQRRLSQIGVVSREQGKSLQSALTQGQRLVSQDGDLWRWDGLTAAAEAPTAAATRLSQRNRLEELDGEIESAEADAKVKREAFHAARQDAEQTAKAETEQRTHLRGAQKAFNGAKELLTKAERDSERNNTRVTALQENVAGLENDLAESADKARTSQEGLERLPAGEGLQDDINQHRSSVGALRIQLSEDRATLEGIERERQARERRLTDIDRESVDWMSRRESASRHIGTLEERAQEIASDLERAKAIPTAIDERRKDLLSHISDAEAKRNTAADALAEAEEHQRQCSQAAKKTSQSLSEVREQRARSEAQVESAHERQNEVAARIQEVLQCLPEDVLFIAEIKDGEELPPLEQTETKLDRLKNERERLGGVNLRAEEEAQELQEQLDSMNADREDLEGAIHKLRTGINSLNKEGRERMLTAFETVNNNFQVLFKTLFGGGEAELRMVESDDPLEAGLEIVAKPPGKKMQVMSLLSGGEQALTAMALIFAVFQANPAPICVLDEVDAPLDDSNVERFCNLLDEMTRSTDTRFLVITHHALTMSRMDRLYGVTMMERGVSHLVSVDLSGAERVLAAE